MTRQCFSARPSLRICSPSTTKVELIPSVIAQDALRRLLGAGKSGEKHPKQHSKRLSGTISPRESPGESDTQMASCLQGTRREPGPLRQRRPPRACSGLLIAFASCRLGNSGSNLLHSHCFFKSCRTGQKIGCKKIYIISSPVGIKKRVACRRDHSLNNASL